ncbi:hypothetical protein C2H92_01255 [Bacillus halotolerans]|nr:hypothetical protein BCV60_16125 [Bacillus halotolerans]UQZ45473.1 hypothetical protein C2H92_01255 [Bacillus halotolerans]
MEFLWMLLYQKSLYLKILHYSLLYTLYPLLLIIHLCQQFQSTHSQQRNIWIDAFYTSSWWFAI